MNLRRMSIALACLLPFTLSMAQAPTAAPAAQPTCHVVKFKAKPGKNAQMEAAMQAHGASGHGKKLIAQLRDLQDGRADATALVLISAK